MSHSMMPAPVNSSALPTSGLVESTGWSIRSTTIAISLILMLVVLWCLSHHYQGFARDGELYAVQALARLHPGLSADVYLANNSQDRYTIFSRIYASSIDAFGLQTAASLLFVLCTIWFLGAAWALARAAIDKDQAWLAVIMLIVTTGFYGAYQVFHYSESYLTARTLAEALVVTALAAHFLGWRRVGLIIAAVALFVHPLMALPGLLLLICLWLDIRRAILGAVAGIVAVLGVALMAAANPQVAHFLMVLDPEWLDVVRQRSQFLFLNYWNLGDWEMHARPFLCLTLSALVLEDHRIRRLCAASMLVGAAGLAIALIAGAVGPVAILVQGQAWRWFWITGFISVLLLAPTALRMWRDERCGPACATLIISGWTFAIVDGTALIALALFLWTLRSHIDIRTGKLLTWAAYALIAVIVAWVSANSWSLVTSPRAESGPDLLFIDRIRSILGLQVSTVLIFGFFWHWIRTRRSIWTPAIVILLLAASLPLIVPASFQWIQTAGSKSEVQEFSDWRGVISDTSNVLIVPERRSASFIWLTLGRPSYLSVDQSAGVVFSRSTAMEIRRRSNVLLPVAKPDWQLLTQITQRAHGKKLEDMTRPLTRKSLAAICSDSQLDFVIAKENLEFNPIRHTHAGAWKNWNLYDCRNVRLAGAAS